MSSSPETVRAHLTISGVVQGVGFRYSARNRAVTLGLNGWVRNAADGAVEAVVEGSNDRVRDFIAWAQHGPSNAQVDQVRTETEPVRGESGFRIIG